MGERVAPVTRAGATAAVLVCVSVVLSSGCAGGGSVTQTSDGATFPIRATPLRLPTVDLPKGFAHSVPGSCVGQGAEVGVLGLPGVPGEGALAPVGGSLKQGPVYVWIAGEAPRIAGFQAGDRGGMVRAMAISRPTYRGPVLIRGGRTDRRGPIRFRNGPGLANGLELGAGAMDWPALGARGASAQSPGWRYALFRARVPSPGCYAFQVDGQGFSYVLPFAVAVPPRLPSLTWNPTRSRGGFRWVSVLRPPESKVRR